MEKKEIVQKYDDIQFKKRGRRLQSFHKFLVSDFYEFISQLEISVREEEIAKAISEDSKLIVPEALGGFNHDKNLNIAFITEDVGHLTGGRYYAWSIAMALVDLGHKVTVYTNQKPVFQNSFSKYKQPEVNVIAKKTVDLQKIDVKADIYIGSPISGSMAAMKLGKKYSKPSFALVFDPFPMMETFIGKRNYSGWERFLAEIKNSDTKIISLCKSTSEYIYEWLNRRKNQVIEINPCINSREKDDTDKEKIERQDYVVFISRLVKHKKFEDVLDAAKAAKIRLKVISSIDGMAAQRLVAQKQMSSQVDFHFKASDKEKFKIIRGARAVINGAIFEGFGMWAAEAVSCGTPLVCYDYPTFREIKEISGADNFYFAEWNQPKDLARKLIIALNEAKFREDNNCFNFESMKNSLKKLIAFEPKIGVITIGLNEEQFIGASLKAVIRHRNISKVAVVEGAVNLFAHACDENGLSIDKTNKEILKIISLENGSKIIYERHGWANNKADLRNRALKLLGNDIDYVLVVDADEVWKQEDLDLLVKTIKENHRIGVIKFPFYHFWKKKDQITTGSMWDSMLFRCFKFEDKSFHWGSHEMPVINNKGQRIDQVLGSIVNKEIHVYHYGAMKDEKNIKDKLKFYAARDTQLKVRDTFSKWKPGQDTQWTHGGGKVEEFKGTHPEEVRGII
jgi:glycosyltransferase involved in cell wall biosynthesis